MLVKEYEFQFRFEDIKQFSVNSEFRSCWLKGRYCTRKHQLSICQHVISAVLICFSKNIVIFQVLPIRYMINFVFFYVENISRQ